MRRRSQSGLNEALAYWENTSFRGVGEVSSHTAVSVCRVGAVLYFSNFVASKPSRLARVSVERCS
ncbi:hypothetical protein [Halocatena pleomorpha]|uniref:Uncharacterized protein n=1 Tax=Halocatena pleomorpha TaxID=1785090 RepID=A0A3P3RME7_9EURY|nr:hypothetical protein [Halocatena pleomorpha]RRJ34050.1 hypothetical protein EIK79_00640 [Halocatena pleomorpha]